MGTTEKVIDDAITAHMANEGPAGVVTGWMVIVGTIDHDGEDERSGVWTIYPGGSMQWPMALGLLEAARIRLHAAFAEGEG